MNSQNDDFSQKISEAFQIVKGVKKAHEELKAFTSKPGMVQVHALNARFGITPRMTGREVLIAGLVALAGFGESESAVKGFKKWVASKYGKVDPNGLWVALIAAYMDEHGGTKVDAKAALKAEGKRIAKTIKANNPDTKTLLAEMAAMKAELAIKGKNGPEASAPIPAE
ncbi:hypothetical protein [Fundidesulfovibrio terrae]|uniref:hypothetical protein n=1 Tax=Fundidesulfovibrio terrae TaxID=2922866 RepID=UPI001FAFCC2A|nr:hypothetical protein [Fundidesulfovibrio terrae]